MTDKMETENEKIFQDITNKMLETYKAKNHDYGNSVHKTFEEFGLTSFLVRLSDKLNRAITLNSKQSKVKDEKIEDTLLDMSVYCILALIELKQQKEMYEKNVLKVVE